MWAISTLSWDTRLLRNKIWPQIEVLNPWKFSNKNQTVEIFWLDQSLAFVVAVFAFSLWTFFPSCSSLFVFAPGPIELWWPVEHRCSRTSFERQGEASLLWGVQDGWCKISDSFREVQTWSVILLSSDIDSVQTVALDIRHWHVEMIHLWSLEDMITVSIITFIPLLLLLASKMYWDKTYCCCTNYIFLCSFPVRTVCFRGWNYMIYSWERFNLLEWAEDKERTAAQRVAVTLYSRAVCVVQVYMVF